MDAQQVREVLRTNMAAMKKDILALVGSCIVLLYFLPSIPAVCYAAFATRWFVVDTPTMTHTHTQLAEVQEAYSVKCREEVAIVHQSTAREVEGYYLRCLHQLVNKTPLTGDPQMHDQQSHDKAPEQSHDQPLLEAESNVRPGRTLQMSHKPTQQPPPVKHARPSGHHAKPSATRLTKHSVPAKSVSSKGQKSQNKPDMGKNLFSGGRVVAQKR